MFLWVVILVITALFVWEYLDHDCINDKQAWYFRSIPEDMTPREKLIEIRKSLHHLAEFTYWRMSLIVALILPLPIVFFLQRRFPSWLEYFFIGVLIFLGTYFALSWLVTHFLEPNTTYLEKQINVVIGKLNS
jgi:hypothetical protein